MIIKDDFDVLDIFDKYERDIIMKKQITATIKLLAIALIFIISIEFLPISHVNVEVKFGRATYSDAWETYKVKTYNIDYCYDINHTFEYMNPVPLNKKYTSRTVQIKTQKGVLHLDGNAEVPFAILLMDYKGNVIET